MANSTKQTAPSQHMFIISSSPYDKPDVATEYSRRAHAARQSRKTARKPTKRSSVKQAQSPPPPTQQIHRCLGSAFLDLPELGEELSSSIVDLVIFTEILQTHPKELSLSSFNTHLDTRRRLQSSPTQAWGLAFLKPPDLVYEASRFGAMIYCDVLASVPTVVAVRKRTGVPTPLPRMWRANFNDEPGGKPTYSHAYMYAAAYGLRYVLNSLFASVVWEKHPAFMLWATVMGGIGAADSPDREWYLDLLKTKCIPLFATWEDARHVLLSHLWDRELLDEAGLNLWNEAT